MLIAGIAATVTFFKVYYLFENAAHVWIIVFICVIEIRAIIARIILKICIFKCFYFFIKSG